MPVHCVWIFRRLWCWFQPHSRISLLDSIHRSRKRGISLRSDDGGDPVRRGPALTHGPAHERLSANDNHTGVIVSVRVLFGIVVEKAERLAQQQNVVRLAG